MEKKGNYDNKNPAWSCEGQVGGSRKQLQLFEVLQKNKVPKPESKSILPWLLIKCNHPLGLEMRPFWQLIICHVSMQISSH